MNNKIGNPFGSNETHPENLRVDGENLYWQGKKVRVGGWSVGEKIAAFVAAVTLIYGLPAFIDSLNKEPQICGKTQEKFCEALLATTPTITDPIEEKPAPILDEGNANQTIEKDANISE